MIFFQFFSSLSAERLSSELAATLTINAGGESEHELAAGLRTNRRGCSLKHTHHGLSWCHKLRSRTEFQSRSLNTLLHCSISKATEICTQWVVISGVTYTSCQENT